MRGYVDMLLITSTANIKTWERDNGLYGGLSPLARGTLLCPGVLLALARFIPAGAGNTLPLSALLARNTVYPRWRGEHKIHIDKHRVCIGLSPLARGTLYYNRWTRYGARFIPAGAGNTNMGSAVNEIKTVYPRWRGEHPFIFVSSWRDLGLSPLARGTRTKYPSLNPRRRFIPAGAGNTIETFHAIKQAAVYPRWRGEHLLIKWRARCVYGLSPLARGTPVVRY